MAEFETHVYDGVTFELDRPYRDLLGVEWVWSGHRDQRGVPLMAVCGQQDVRPAHLIALDVLYQLGGPLYPLPCPRTMAAVRRSLFRGVA